MKGGRTWSDFLVTELPSTSKCQSNQSGFVSSSQELDVALLKGVSRKRKPVTLSCRSGVITPSSSESSWASGGQPSISFGFEVSSAWTLKGREIGLPCRFSAAPPLSLSPSTRTFIVNPSGNAVPLPLFSFFATAYFCGATWRVRTRIACCTVLRTSRAHLTLPFSILSSVKVDGDHFPSTSHSRSDPSGDQRAGRISSRFMWIIALEPWMIPTIWLVWRSTILFSSISSGIGLTVLSNALTPYSRFGEILDGEITYPDGNLSSGWSAASKNVPVNSAGVK